MAAFHVTLEKDGISVLFNSLKASCPLDAIQAIASQYNDEIRGQSDTRYTVKVCYNGRLDWHFLIKYDGDQLTLFQI